MPATAVGIVILRIASFYGRCPIFGTAVFCFVSCVRWLFRVRVLPCSISQINGLVYIYISYGLCVTLLPPCSGACEKVVHFDAGFHIFKKVCTLFCHTCE